MGCSVLGAVLVPLWMILSCSALYLVPGLGGDWYLDPEEGIHFQYYPPMLLLLRGGFVGAMALAMATPLFSYGYLVATGFSLFSRSRAASETRALQARVGQVALDLPLVVRKRSKTGRTAHALPIRTQAASPLRRSLARVIDVGVLSATVAGAALFGGMLETTGAGWEALTGDYIWPLVLASGGALTIVQWLAVFDRAQTLGMSVFDIRTGREIGDRPTWSTIAVRHLGFDLVDGVIAGLLAAGVAALAFGAAESGGVASVFAPAPFRLAVGWAVWTTALLVLPGLRSLSLLFGRPWALHDLVSGVGVVRTAVGDLDSDRVAPLGYRIVARVLDDLLLIGVAGLPLLVATAFLDMPYLVLLLVLVALVAAWSVRIWQWVELVRRGSTIGKRMVGLEVVADSGERTFVNVVLVREWLVYSGLGAVLPYLGVLLNGVSVLSEDRLALHDRLAGTRVVWTYGPD